jgi:four helix bundle protein
MFQVTVAFPKEEMFSLTDQVRRSSRSVGAQIAEAWAKRQYQRHFLSKLTDADGEQQETQHWIETAVDCGYLTTEEALKLTEKCEEIGRLLGGMMAKSDLFCGKSTRSIHDQTAKHFINKQLQATSHTTQRILNTMTDH